MLSRRAKSLADLPAICTFIIATGSFACQPAGVSTGAECPSQQTLTYENFGRAFMQSYCLSCHDSKVPTRQRKGAPSDHNFDKLSDIRSFAEHIDLYTGSGPLGTNMTMPPDDPTPTLEERRKLSEWLACGAP